MSQDREEAGVVLEGTVTPRVELVRDDVHPYVIGFAVGDSGGVEYRVDRETAEMIHDELGEALRKDRDDATAFCPSCMDFVEDEFVADCPECGQELVIP